MNSSQAFSHSRMIAPYRCAPLLGQLVQRGPGRGGVHRGVDRLDVAFEGVPVPLDASRNVLRIRWMMQVWTVVSGHTFADHVGQALQPVADQEEHVRARRGSSCPAARYIQNLAPSPPVPAHSPRTSLRPSRVTPIAA